METLPLVLSQLLDLAVQDGQKCEARPSQFTFDMGIWVMPEYDGDDEPIPDAPCRVCMAGAVMVHTLECPTDRQWEVDELDDDDDQHALLAINDMRTGDFAEALATIRYQHKSELVVSDDEAATLRACHALVRRDYAASGPESIRGRAPWKTYTECARILREVGL